jgi:hypothetical protein
MAQKRNVVRALFDQPESLRSEEVADSEILKNLMKAHVPIAIELAIASNKIYASIFEINDSDCYLEIHKKHWAQALETCLLWYVEDEDYETCNHIKSLIHSVKEKNKTSKVSFKNNKNGEGL